MSAPLTLEEAQARLLALAPSPRIETVPASDALGRYLASDVLAQRTQPAADLSAMDGYAVAGEGPWERVGESRAGVPYPGVLSAGQCVRISTGAHVPSGSDRILIQENAEVQGTRVIATQEAELGQHIRKRGFDFGESDLLLKAGTAIGPGQIALCLSAGLPSLPVIAQPAVTVIDTGDELVSDVSQCQPHQTPASNGAMIAAMVAPLIGKNAVVAAPVADRLDALLAALEEAQASDIIVTTGGASVGDHDHVQRAFADAGAEVAFWKVAIKPGKPIMVATRTEGSRRQVLIGLPGNPVSSFVTCFLFVLPLVRAWIGDKSPLPNAQTMTLDQALPATGLRREFLRAVSDGQSVVMAGSQDSSALRALADANCLIDRLPHSEAAVPGEAVRVYYL